MSLVRSLVTAAAGIAALATPSLAQAQAADPVSATGKGITGGALLGGEVVLLTEAVIGVQPAWAYLVGGIAGAGAGAFGGYYAEQEGSAKLSLYLLAGGMALAIPTTVAVLSATAYQPPADYTEDQAPTDEPAATPATPAPGAASSKTTPRRMSGQYLARGSRLDLRLPAVPPSLLALDAGTLALSLPAVEVRDRWSRREIFEYGVRQGTELRIPVFSALF